MNIPVTSKIPDLWGDHEFAKSEWGSINYLVGPNGTGKTRLAEHLKQALERAGFKPRYLSAERLAGLEKGQVMGGSPALHRGFNVGSYPTYKAYAKEQGLAADAFILLKEKLNLRIKIEAFLSSLFGRRIRFAEEGGFLVPKIQRTFGGTEYAMRESECHGLKELITLLAFIYDDGYNALIIDEPELHLHPQFQTFLLAEMRKIAGDPRTQPATKTFFLITHSPFCLDFRSIDELRHCVLFHSGGPPSMIGQLSQQDEFSLKRLLPRLNTHHKQFFFANRPIFVEGYTDQQLFTLVQDSRGKLLGATGACFIDVNGKDEQDFFFRLCQQLGVKAQFIADLDVLTRGNFRDSVSSNPKSQKYVTEQGVGTSLMDAIRELNIRLDSLVRAVEGNLEPALAEITTTIQQATETEQKRYRMLLAVIHRRESIVTAMPDKMPEVEYVAGKLYHISEASKQAGVFLLPKGALENHLPSYEGLPYSIPDKAKATAFDVEREFILASERSAIEARYADLLGILDAASGSAEVDLRKHLGYALGELIGNIQRAFERKEITSAETLKAHAAVDWPTFSRVADLITFTSTPTAFQCRLKLKSIVDAAETEFTFEDSTVHSKFSVP
jgi:hypothetical protein